MQPEPPEGWTLDTAALTYADLWRVLAAQTPAAGVWERRAVAVRSLRRLLT